MSRTRPRSEELPPLTANTRADRRVILALIVAASAYRLGVIISGPLDRLTKGWYAQVADGQPRRSIFPKARRAKSVISRKKKKKDPNAKKKKKKTTHKISWEFKKKKKKKKKNHIQNKKNVVFNGMVRTFFATLGTKLDITNECARAERRTRAPRP